MYTLTLLWTICAAPLLAFPTHSSVIDELLQQRSPSFEWTAWGDSYASGVGAGPYDNGRRCLRYQDAYPQWINDDPAGLLPGSGGKFNNVVCSGAKAEEVEAYQFYTTDQKFAPNRQYAPRPAYGKPTMGTLTVGGDDIDFPGILNNCIVEGFPFGFVTRSCDDQRQPTWPLIGQGGSHDQPNSVLVAKLDSLIKKTVTAGRGASGDLFRLYVTGYGQFFNDQDHGCDTVSFARAVNPNDDGKSHVRMTTELRSDFNAMSRLLNAAIKQAVDLNSNSNVKYIDIDTMLGGHRFCEPGIIEPDQNNPNAYFFHYPYRINTIDSTPDPGVQYLIKVANDSASSLSWDPKQTLWVDYMNAFWTLVDDQQLYDAIGIDSGDNVTAEYNIWSDTIGHRARLFHPQKSYAESIYRAIVQQYKDDTAMASNSTSSGQQMALATYIDPGANPDIWKRLIAFPSDKVSILIANVVNGPDSSVNSGWTSVITQAAASGKTVLGYVRTGYLGVSFQQFTTRLGSSKTSDWIAQIQQDVDQWYRLYPIGGIFFDEGWNDCGPNNINAELYKFITQSTKRKYPGALTVLNPGAPMPQCFEKSADTLLTFEDSYATYTSSAFVPNTWTPSDPRKLWHIIFDVPTGQGATIAALALTRGAGMVDITNDVEPNPYDTLPDDTYMQQLLDAVPGGTPLNEGLYPYLGGPVTSTPGGFQIDSFDYSSATFSWSASANAIGYQIYQGSSMILSLTPTMTTVTVGGLDPGSTYSFQIVALNGDGSQTGMSNTVLITTLSLPNAGQTVSSTSISGGASSTVYQASILVPYAFVRVFMFELYHGGYDYSCDWIADPGWPVNFDAWDSVCNHYMIEGGTLYKYTGNISTTGNAPWSWTSVAPVPLVQNGYDYTWTVPIGSSTIDTSQYMIQVQNYGPKANVYHTCPWTTPTIGVTPQYCL